MKVTYTEAEISALNTIKNIDQSDIQHTNQGRTQRKNLIKGFKFTEQEIYNFKRNSSEFKTEEQIEYKKALDKANKPVKPYANYSELEIIRTCAVDPAFKSLYDNKMQAYNNEMDAYNKRFPETKDGFKITANDGL